MQNLWNTFWTAGANDLAPFHTLFAGINTLFAGVNLFALFLLAYQIRATQRQAVKDDIVTAGRHGDDIYGSLFGVSDEEMKRVVRQVYGDEIAKIEQYIKDNPSTPPVEFCIHEFWYVRRIFAHVARMANLAESEPVKYYFERWIAELVLRMKESTILRALAIHSLYSPAWNLTFRDRLWERLKESESFDKSRLNLGQPSKWQGTAGS